ncbi:MAG: imidazole glycerol phosphate synthase subunit HisH [Acidobacteriota bacterium]|nr:imidazole glycerol phosphate synthase subunit HisH [Acidobacteriota bacterium]
MAIVDYGTSNLTSVVKALRAAGLEPSVAKTVRDVSDAAGLVVPGVGHFNATLALDDDWRASVLASVARGVPLLGICLGMQWLFEGSEEAPGVRGLGALDGRIVRLTGNVKIPHVGWNALRQSAPSPLFEGLADGAEVYFTHSFAAPISAATIATSEHGTVFSSVVSLGRVTGMQFHPEKSGAAGITLLRNWASQVAAC